MKEFRWTVPCGELRWYNGVGDRLYSVPGLSGGRLPIVEVSDPRESLIKELSSSEDQTHKQAGTKKRST